MSEWSNWKPFPEPMKLKDISVPAEPGVYQLKNQKTSEYVLFGIGKDLRKRMKSLYPQPYGIGTRNNVNKRIYVLENWKNIEFRYMRTETRKEAAIIEQKLKEQGNHIFNT